MGISRHQLGNGTLTRLTRGVYVQAGGPAEFEQRARAVLLAAGPRSALSHFSAARVLGGVVPPHSRVHVTTQRTQRIRRTGVTAHRTRGLLPTVAVRGITVTSGLRTFLDLSSLLDLVDLVVLGDSLVKSNAATTTELIEGTRSWRGPAVAQARVAAGYVREGVGSPMESRLRMLIVLAGLPEPEVDHCLYSQKGQLLYRLDLAYAGCRVGIEYDGRQHAESESQWLHDIHRREDLDGSGWRLIVVVGKQLYGDPGAVLDRVVATARERGMTMPDPNNGWLDHFPVTKR